MIRLLHFIVHCALVMLTLSAAHAAPQHWSITGAIESGPLKGQGFTGTFTFRDDSPSADAEESWLTVESLQLDFAGEVFTLTDAAAPAEAKFSQGHFLGLSFSSASTRNPQISFIPGFMSLDEAYLAYDFGPNGSGTASTNYAPVPEPTPSALLLAGLGLAGLILRRRTHSLPTQPDRSLA